MDENQEMRAQTELRRLDEKKAALEKILRRLDERRSGESREADQDVDPFEIVEHELKAIEKQKELVQAKVESDRDFQVATSLRNKGQQLADQAQATWEPRLQRLTWTLTGIGGAILSTAYVFLRSDAEPPALIYLQAAMVMAALALAVHLLVQLLHVLVDHMVIARANGIAAAQHFDDPMYIFEWLESTTQTMLRWHMRLPTIGLMVQAGLVMVAFGMMLVGIVGA